MWTCPKCERDLQNPKQWHNCVKVDIGDLFKGKAQKLEFVFDRLLAEIVNWENVAVSATKNCIVFVRKKTFLIVKPMKTQLDLKFYSETELYELPVIKSIIWNSKFETHVRVAKLEELTTAVYSLIKMSYEIS
jgi:Domain of unknown function (DUF5655)